MYTPDDENYYYFYNEEELIDYLKQKIANIRKFLNCSHSTALKILNLVTNWNDDK